MEYSVLSFYDYNGEVPVDTYSITHTKEDDYAEDGNNWVGNNDAYDFHIENDLENAIRMAGFWAPNIKYGRDFTDEEKNLIVKVTNDLIHNEDYIKKFCNKTIAIKTFTMEDILYCDENAA